MSEQLLKTKDVANRLSVPLSTFYRLRAKLIAQGLKRVKVGKSTRYLESSLDKVILKMVED